MTGATRSPRAGVADPAGETGGSGLAARQAALVAALVAGGPLPAGFDAQRVGAAAAALRRKRAGEVARAWPLLAADLGTGFRPRFATWAEGRPSAGSFADGFAYARFLRDSGELPPLGAAELAGREAAWAFDGASPPRRRSRPDQLLHTLALRARRVLVHKWITRGK